MLSKKSTKQILHKLSPVPNNNISQIRINNTIQFFFFSFRTVFKQKKELFSSPSSVNFNASLCQWIKWQTLTVWIQAGWRGRGEKGKNLTCKRSEFKNRISGAERRQKWRGKEKERGKKRGREGDKKGEKSGELEKSCFRFSSTESSTALVTTAITTATVPSVGRQAGRNA